MTKLKSSLSRAHKAAERLAQRAAEAKKVEIKEEVARIIQQWRASQARTLGSRKRQST